MSLLGSQKCRFWDSAPSAPLCLPRNRQEQASGAGGWELFQMLPEDGRPTCLPAQPQPPGANNSRTRGPSPPHPAVGALPISALSIWLSLLEQRRAKGNPTNCKQKLPNPKLATGEGSEQSQNRLSPRSLGICFKSPHWLLRKAEVQRRKDTCQSHSKLGCSQETT